MCLGLPSLRLSVCLCAATGELVGVTRERFGGGRREGGGYPGLPVVQSSCSCPVWTRLARPAAWPAVCARVHVGETTP